MRQAVTVRKVLSADDREAALAVVAAVYGSEKQWIADPRAEIPERPGEHGDRSWFVVAVGERPAGVIRLVYDPGLELPAELQVTLDPAVDLSELRRRARFVDIGRFMILPRYRRDIRVVTELMRASIVEVVERGYTHFLTDVFASDPHSPLRFHTRVLGFERIGTHRYGELACASERIILVLDIVRAYQRLKRRPNRIWKELGLAVSEILDRRLAASPA